MATVSKKSTASKTVKAPIKSRKLTAKKTTPARKPAPVAPVKAAPVAPEAKIAKPKKQKLVRDSFTIPKIEYVVLDELKLRAAKLAHPVKKSELLRAGIKALTGMSDTALLSALKAVPTIKTGRPKKT
ncbi:MAG: hypothetical protein Q8K91_15025 [Hylemonella sp.]|nr:hypothetical protein [Hylemonella sp.]MDP1938514.1 hypothetical protein [Hylemonella sp.]